MGENKPWYDKGYDDLDDYKPEYSNQPRRFWMPKGSTKTIIYIDDNPFRFYEHQLYMNGNWYNWFTCLKQGAPSTKCMLGEMLDNKAYYVGLYTIIDCSEWIDKQGVKHCNVKKIFAAKVDTMKRLRLKKDVLGKIHKIDSLVGCKFEVSRVGDKSENVGNNFEFIEKMTMGDIDTLVNAGKVEKEKVDIKQFDYEEIFKPLSKERLEAIVSKVLRKGSPEEPKGSDQPEY